MQKAAGYAQKLILNKCYSNEGSMWKCTLAVYDAASNCL